MDVSADEKQRIREKIEKLKQSKFKQQTLPAWRPVPTAMSTMFTFSIFSVTFLAIGVVLYVMSDQIVESVIRYDDLQPCRDLLKEENRDSGGTCQVDLPPVDADIKGPIYVYYQLDNFYQNHRRYVKSRNNDQLVGNYKKVDELTDCDPIIKVADLWENQKYPYAQKIDSSIEKKQLDPEDPAIPCGLVAKSFFNDTFQLFKKNPDGDDTQVTIKEDQIAWTSDKQYKFENLKSPPNGATWQELQWLDMKDEHFIVWMRTAGLPNFRKLWGRIDSGLEKGDYYIKIKNSYEVAPFQGQKKFVISTTNALGGKNYFLAVCYITVGTLCLLFAFIFCVAYMKRRGTSQSQSS